MSIMLNIQQFKAPVAAGNRRSYPALIWLHSLHAGRLTVSTLSPIAVFNSGHSCFCYLLYQCTDHGGMDGLVNRVPALGIEPGPARLMAQEIRLRATYSLGQADRQCYLKRN